MSNKFGYIYLVLALLILSTLGYFYLFHGKAPTGTVVQSGIADGTFKCTYDFCKVEGVMPCNEHGNEYVVLRFTNPDLSSGWIGVNDGSSDLVPYHFYLKRDITTSRTDSSACAKSNYYVTVRKSYGKFYLATYNRAKDVIVIIKPERKSSGTVCHEYYYKKDVDNVPAYFPLTINPVLQFFDREVYNSEPYQCQANFLINGKKYKSLVYAGNTPQTLSTGLITLKKGDVASFLPYQIKFSSYYAGCGPCTLGSSICVSDGTVKTCQMVNETACNWVEQTCQSPMVCENGACRCPTDGSYCSLTQLNQHATKCMNNKVYECSLPSGKCPVWTLKEDCSGEGMICKE